MRDCENAEIRDRLPDLLHGRLDGPARSEALAHLAACADCATELDLLRSVNAACAAATPAVDVGRIVDAIVPPGPTMRRASRPDVRRVSWRRRVGTGVSLALAAGLGALVMLRQDVVPTSTVTPGAPAVERSALVPAPAVGAPAASAAPARATSPTAAQPAERELAVDESLGDISDGALLALLNEIETLEAVQVAEPDEPLPMPAREVVAPDGGEER
jgi:anti-sigma factor RsiW